MNCNISAVKEFTFDCAHMLSEHPGLCMNLHGHTYKMHVEVSHKGGLEAYGPAEGMVMDFKDLKQAVHDHIIYHFDHAFVYYKHGNEVERAIGELLLSQGLKVAEVSYRPTAENMASSFFYKLCNVFRGTPIVIQSVTVWETPTSFAKASKG